MNSSKDEYKGATITDMATMPTLLRKPSDIMADYLEGRITYAEAKSEVDAANAFLDQLPDYTASPLVSFLAILLVVEEPGNTFAANKIESLAVTLKEKQPNNVNAAILKRLQERAAEFLLKHKEIIA